jgi:hypothetical protein
MSVHKRISQTPPELLPIAERLRAERPTATEPELDRAKLRALAQAERKGAARSPRMRDGAVIRSRRVISVALAIGLMGGGTAVIAKSGGPSASSSNQSSANSQYCPPSSQQPGKPKKPGPAKCGKP